MLMRYYTCSSRTDAYTSATRNYQLMVDVFGAGSVDWVDYGNCFGVIVHRTEYTPQREWRYTWEGDTANA